MGPQATSRAPDEPNYVTANIGYIKTSFSEEFAIYEYSRRMHTRHLVEFGGWRDPHTRADVHTHAFFAEFVPF